jgi:ketosteroid isomerase-like protein
MHRSIFFLTGFIVMSIFSDAQSSNEKQILGILEKQTQAWNRGDLASFMVGYWQNDSLMYIGKSGITYGYAYTLANYKRNYADTASMGKLSFTILQLKKLSDEYYFLVGKWHLKRSIGDVGGHYSLLFRKINGEWTIVADHSS